MKVNNKIKSSAGAALPIRKANARVVVPLLWSSYYLLFVYTQGSVRAFGTLATLGNEEYRAYGTRKAEV